MCLRALFTHYLLNTLPSEDSHQERFETDDDISQSLTDLRFLRTFLKPSEGSFTLHHIHHTSIAVTGLSGT